MACSFYRGTVETLGNAGRDGLSRTANSTPSGQGFGRLSAVTVAEQRQVFQVSNPSCVSSLNVASDVALTSHAAIYTKYMGH